MSNLCIQYQKYNIKKLKLKTFKKIFSVYCECTDIQFYNFFLNIIL